MRSGHMSRQKIKKVNFECNKIDTRDGNFLYEDSDMLNVYKILA